MQIFVGPGKVFAAEKSPVGRQRGGMDGFEDAVALGIGDGAFALGVTSPQHVNDALLALCDGPHDRIGESFPAVSCVGGRFVRPDRQHGIE